MCEVVEATRQRNVDRRHDLLHAAAAQLPLAAPTPGARSCAGAPLSARIRGGHVAQYRWLRGIPDRGARRKELQLRRSAIGAFGTG